MRDESWFPSRGDTSPEVDPSEFRFHAVGSSPQNEGEIADWFADWLILDRIPDKIRQMQMLFDCPVISDFTTRLFQKAQVVGLLCCSHTTRSETDTCWVVLQRSECASREIDANTLIDAPVNDFFYLCEPGILQVAGKFDWAIIEKRLELHNLVNRFFCVYGGLRESTPHFGGDYFNGSPCNPVLPSLITSRVHDERKWLDAVDIHTSRHCDYLLVRKDGVVGYMPIEIDRRIEIYAPSFEAALDRWLDSGAYFE